MFLNIKDKKSFLRIKKLKNKIKKSLIVIISVI